jgi:peptide/nickel transport system substrate-binding protein
MKRSLALILAIIMTVALVACGGNPGTSSGSSSAGTSSAAGTTDIKDINKEQDVKVDETKTYKKELSIPFSTNITQMDSMLLSNAGTAPAYMMMYNQLVAYNWDEKKIEPELAESWTVESTSSYVFNLRKGVKFSNGEELTADDVVFSFVDRPKAVEGTTGTAVWNEIEKVEVINDYSVRFVLNTKDADFLYRLYLVAYSVLNREACEKDAENGHMVGTCGWIVESWAPGEHVTFVRNDTSWIWEETGVNPTEKVVFRFMNEPAARTIALQNGEIAVNHKVNDADVATLETDKNVHVATISVETLYYIAFNMQNGKLANNAKLRQAVAYALNYDEILDLETNGLGERAISMWGKNQYGLYEDFAEQYEYNPEKAKQLMADAGYPDGFEMLLIGNTGAQALIQDQLKEVGITVTVEKTNSAAIKAAVADGKFDALIYNISLQPIGDRFALIPNVKHSTNRAKYDNPEMMEKFAAALAENDDAKRKEIYKEIQIELHEEIPYLPLWYDSVTVGWCDGVSGVKWEANSYFDYSHIKWEE